MSAVLEKILEEVNALSESERRELLAMLNAAEPAPTQAKTEEQLYREMEAKGIITLPKRPLLPFEPVECGGQPVSELLMQERR